ncbi:MAG: hypothetical protein Kow0029_03940 [Candidatus Rifleibacteriota bacterium]
MEHFYRLNMCTISHHSFMRWAETGAAKKEERVVNRIFDPANFDEDSMEREFMLTALSA